MMNNSITTVSFMVYRHIAYRRFVLWIWHRLGRGNRKIIPGCVVTKMQCISLWAVHWLSVSTTNLITVVQTCSIVLLRVGLYYTAPILRSTMVVGTPGVYLHPRPAVWYERNCLLRSTRLMRKMSMYSTIS